MDATPNPALPDDENLLTRVRAGDATAYAELWRRHSAAGLRAARSVTSSIDPDDLVAEAYARILATIRNGKGPSGAFRPYLYTVIRNLAATWGARSELTTLDDAEEIVDARTMFDPAEAAADRTLTLEAFAALPERWQTVLWYTEVEGMDPQEMAPLLGMTPNGVAALAYRARDGLRKAWVRAHVAQAARPDECVWTVEHLQSHRTGKLTPQKTARVLAHLEGCENCRGAAAEIAEVSSRLALVLLPAVLGTSGAAALLAAGGGPSGATVAAAAEVASSVGGSGSGSGSGSGGSVAGGAGGSSSSGGPPLPVVLGIAAGTVLVVGAVIGITVALADPPDPTILALPEGDEDPAPAASPAPTDAASPDDASDPDPDAADPALAPLAPPPSAAPLASALPPNTSPIASPAPARPSPSIPAPPSELPPAPSVVSLALDPDGNRPVLSGTGIPDATVEIRSSAGALLAATTVRPDGGWVGPPLSGTEPIDLTFVVTQTTSAGRSAAWTSTGEASYAPSVSAPDVAADRVSWTFAGWPGARWEVRWGEEDEVVLRGEFDADGHDTRSFPRSYFTPGQTRTYQLYYVAGDRRGVGTVYTFTP